MPTLFVDNAGSNTSPYDTWAKAATTLATAAGAAAAGDTIYVASTHSESTAGAVTITFTNGTTTLPVYVYCAVPSGASGVSALATTAAVATTGASNLVIARSCYVYGVQFSAGGGGSNNANIHINNTTIHWQRFDSCVFTLATTQTSRAIYTSNSNQTTTEFLGCGFSLSATNQYIAMNTGSICKIRGGSLLASSGTGPTFYAGPGSYSLISGFDLSAANSAADIFYATSAGVAIFRAGKTPASWSGALHSGTSTTILNETEMHCTDSADTNYRIQKRTIAANMVQETALVRTGGATDGTTPLSWKIVSTANCDWHRTFTTPEIVRWNETTGSALTATVEILRDSATNLTDAEIWLEVMYLGTSGVPLGTWTSDRAADILATPADQADSSATWTTTGMSNPNTQKLSVSFTPQEKGYVHARVVVAKASTTVYVDPVITLA